MPCRSPTRLTSLVDIATRVAVGDAIEATLGTGTPHDVAATLLVARADAIPVRLTLAPIRAGVAVAGVAALIVRTPT